MRWVWRICDERLGLLDARDALQLDAALDEGDVSKAWMAWSGAAETALVDASRLAGGLELARGFWVGGGAARVFFFRSG